MLYEVEVMVGDEWQTALIPSKSIIQIVKQPEPTLPPGDIVWVVHLKNGDFRPIKKESVDMLIENWQD